jgi:DNA modification methylase
MEEVKDNEIGLIITSPPYYNYKNYGDGIGTERDYSQYIENLKTVFAECHRVLRPDGKMCINITNMKSRNSIEKECYLYPIIADVTKSCNDIGFKFFDEIIWVKGKGNAGALKGKPLFGSYPYPTNFKILDSIQESILIFKKTGKRCPVSTKIKQASKITKKEWQQYTQGVWFFQPERQNNGHPAVFPEELPKRLIKLYSFVGDKVLDPFLGSGTVIKAALKLGRIGLGYEINKTFSESIKEKISCTNGCLTESR